MIRSEPKRGENVPPGAGKVLRPRTGRHRGGQSPVWPVVPLGDEKQMESGPGPAGLVDLLLLEASRGSWAPRRWTATEGWGQTCTAEQRVGLWCADMRPDGPDVRTELGPRKGSGGGADLGAPGTLLLSGRLVPAPSESQRTAFRICTPRGRPSQS